MNIHELESRMNDKEKELKEHYSKLSNSDIFNFLLDFINYHEELSLEDEIRRSVILSEIEERLNCT